MKNVTLLCVAVLVAAGALAAPPSKIIVKYDVRSGYGEAVITALKTKWPTANITSYSGSNWRSFNTALTTQGPWNVVVVEAHYYTTSTASHYQNLANWYKSKVGPLFYADWAMWRPYNAVLETAMGISNPAGVRMPPKAHYAWATTHAICSGITSWTYVNPGYGYGGNAIPWTTATPVTGWTEKQTTGRGGICVAPDKRSIVSGYFPSLHKTQAAKLWANILEFMWPSVGVAPASLGKVKALYK